MINRVFIAVEVLCGHPDCAATVAARALLASASALFGAAVNATLDEREMEAAGWVAKKYDGWTCPAHAAEPDSVLAAIEADRAARTKKEEAP